jgi:hypothetical protein
MGDTRTKGPYVFTPQELRAVEAWFSDVRRAAGDELSEKEILLLYANDRTMRPKP